MAMTLRLPAALEAEAAAYAASLGLSFNNLVAVALREYLDARPAPAALPAASTSSPDQTSSSPPASPPGKLSPAERIKLKAQAKRAGGAS